METPSSGSSVDQALQVCNSCKTRKRKCDKALPSCSLCLKRNWKCEYSTPEPKGSTTPDSGQLWFSLFNDDDQVEFSQIPTAVPEPVLGLLGGMDEIRATTSRFFGYIHLWMPFISKKRFYELHLRPSFQSRPEVVLLLLSLKLITTLPPTNPRNARTSLYHATKHFYVEVEGSSTFSIVILQAGVLLALYELGHAIYPAAFLSIGACARYAHALGIISSRQLSSRRILTMVEVEERRRVWWAIVILDRLVSIGCPGRPFGTADPVLDDLLPADDALWDQGIVRSDDAFTLSSPMTGHMSKFALLCQAARLLGQVLHYVSSEASVQDDVWLQLDRTLQSMLAASLDVEPPDDDQITFVYSTIVALHAPWLSSHHADPVNADRSERAKAVIQQVTETVSSNLSKRQCFVGRDPESISPWGMFFAYHICAFQMRTGRVAADETVREVVRILKETFVAVDARWNAAGAYLQLLEAQEVMNTT